MKKFTITAQISNGGGKVHDYADVVEALTLDDALELVKRQLRHRGMIFRITSIAEKNNGNGNGKNLSAQEK